MFVKVRKLFVEIRNLFKINLSLFVLKDSKSNLFAYIFINALVSNIPQPVTSKNQDLLLNKENAFKETVKKIKEKFKGRLKPFIERKQVCNGKDRLTSTMNIYNYSIYNK